MPLSPQMQYPWLPRKNVAGPDSMLGLDPRLMPRTPGYDAGRSSLGDDPVPKSQTPGGGGGPTGGGGGPTGGGGGETTPPTREIPAPIRGIPGQSHQQIPPRPPPLPIGQSWEPLPPPNEVPAPIHVPTMHQGTQAPPPRGIPGQSWNPIPVPGMGQGPVHGGTGTASAGQSQGGPIQVPTMHQGTQRPAPDPGAPPAPGQSQEQLPPPVASPGQDHVPVPVIGPVPPSSGGGEPGGGGGSGPVGPSPGQSQGAPGAPGGDEDTGGFPVPPGGGDEEDDGFGGFGAPPVPGPIPISAPPLPGWIGGGGGGPSSGPVAGSGGGGGNAGGADEGEDWEYEMARGGIATRPTRVKIGEAGPEAVVKMPRPGAMEQYDVGERPMTYIRRNR